MNRISLSDKYVLVTGAAGFIGANLVMRIMNEEPSCRIVGLDNLNDYYDVSIKEYRLEQIKKTAETTGASWEFVKGSIADKDMVNELFAKYSFSVVVNLAAQAGVRYSLINPDAYIETNIVGFYNIVEACRHSYDNGKSGVEHLVYASSSSVYGTNSHIPYSVEDPVEHPVSLYAATKKSDELIAHAYSKLYSIPSTGLRFFTVYGPAGRPDMAYFGFTDKLKKNEVSYDFVEVMACPGGCVGGGGQPIHVTMGVFKVMQGAPDKRTGEDGLPVPPYALYNIGNSSPVELMDFIEILGDELKKNGETGSVWEVVFTIYNLSKTRGKDGSLVLKTKRYRVSITPKFIPERQLYRARLINPLGFTVMKYSQSEIRS